MTDSIQQYASKATAVRGLERAGMDKTRASEFITEVGGKWQFDRHAVDKALGLADVSEEDENLILTCGHSHCPGCGISLTNGLSDFEGMVDRHDGSERKAWLHGQKHEWMCLGCNHEFGAEIPEPKGSGGRAAPTRHYVNKSTVTDVVAMCHDLYSANPELRRKDAIQAAVDKGAAYYTARTQYQKWFKAKKATQAK